MRLQAFGVVFALVIIPLILVLSYYIGLQVDTLTLQKEYDSKLLGATYDAMSSFELNTANEDLSSVSDSLRTIIEASTNVFINSLSTNLGLSNASKSYVEPYIPAVLYTLYDGYYIYAPTRVNSVLTDSDGVAVSVGDKGVKYLRGSAGNAVYSYDENAEDTDSSYEAYRTEMGLDYGSLLYETSTEGEYTATVANASTKTKNVLKSYMPYSARYKTTDVDITVIYTLDNFVTIEGTINTIYYTKSGYLLESGLVTSISNNLTQYNQNDAQEFIEAGNNVSVNLSDGTVIQSGGGVSISYNDIRTNNPSSSESKTLISKSECDEIILFLENQIDDMENEIIIRANNGGISTTDYNSYTNDQLNSIMENDNLQISQVQYYLDKISSNCYYVKGEIFTKWIENVGLKNLSETSIVEISGMDYKTISGSDYESDSMYNFTNSNLKIFGDEFETHKYNVIKNSIQYNLNLAMTTYNNNEVYSFDYAMPVLEESVWEQITSRVSITSFMQGYKCGLKTYSNYKVVSSSNNEISVNPEDIYYVDKNTFNNEEAEYHTIDCDKLYNYDTSNGSSVGYIAFNSKEVKYDKIYNKTESRYKYDHKNYACYFCINDTNYNRLNLFDTTDANYANYANLRKAYYIGLGKVRNNLYKMNAFENSEGYEVILYPNNPADLTSSKYDLSKIKSIEITFGTIKTSDDSETIIQFSVKNSSANLNSEVYRVPTNQTAKYTITVDVNPLLSGGTVNKQTLKFEDKIGGTSGIYYDKADGTRVTVATVSNGYDEILKNSIEYIKIIYK